MRGYVQEGRRWLEQALTSDRPELRAERAKALNAAGAMCSVSGTRAEDFARATSLHETAEALARAWQHPGHRPRAARYGIGRTVRG